MSKARSWWRSQALRGLAFQLLAVALAAFGAWYLAHNTLANMQARGINALWNNGGIQYAPPIR